MSGSEPIWEFRSVSYILFWTEMQIYQDHVTNLIVRTPWLRPWLRPLAPPPWLCPPWLRPPFCSQRVSDYFTRFLLCYFKSLGLAGCQRTLPDLMGTYRNSRKTGIHWMPSGSFRSCSTLQASGTTVSLGTPALRYQWSLQRRDTPVTHHSYTNIAH